MSFVFDNRGGSITNSTVGMNNRVIVNHAKSAPDAMPPPSRGPWRVFLSHTSELRIYPTHCSYINHAEEGVIAAGHVPISMKHFPAVDEPPVAYDSRRVDECDVYMGIYGLRWGTPVLENPSLSYTEDEFNKATAKGIPRLIFIVDTKSTELGIPPNALLDPDHGHHQQAFLKRVLNSGLVAKFFSNPYDLKCMVERSLRDIEKSPKLLGVDK
jgi:hypothetical protein